MNWNKLKIIRSNPLIEKTSFAESLYLMYYALTIFISIRDLTMIKAILPLPKHYDLYLYAIGIIIVVYKIICERNWERWEILFAGLWVVAIVGMSLVYQKPLAISLTLLMLGAHGVDYRKFILIHLTISFVFIIVLFILSNNGIIQNFIFFRDGKDRISFGYGYPTSFAAHMFYICCQYIWLRERKTSWIELLIILRLGIFCYQYCDARTSLVCFVVLTIVSAYLKIRHDSGNPSSYEMNKCISWLFCMAMPLLAMLNIGLSYAYNPNYSFLRFLDKLLSTRLSLGRLAFDRYDIKMFGQVIRENSTSAKLEVVGEFFVIDPSYMKALLKYGYLFLILMVLMTVICSFREKANKNWWHLSILMLLSSHCFIENHLYQIAYHPFLLLVFAKASALSEGLDYRSAKQLFFPQKDNQQP